MNRVRQTILLLVSVIICEKISAQTIDQCTRPAICYSGERAGDPSDCLKFYECDFLGVWKVKTCSNGQQFDSASLECVTSGSATCLSCERNTESTTIVTTLTPIMCDNSTSGSSCTSQGDKVADVSDCHYFFQCRSLSWYRDSCSPAQFIFDINAATCLPVAQAHCDYRCKTPAPPTPTTDKLTTFPVTTSTLQVSTTTSLTTTINLPSSTNTLSTTELSSQPPVSLTNSSDTTMNVTYTTMTVSSSSITTTVTQRTSTSFVSEASQLRTFHFTRITVLLYSLTAILVSAIACS